MQATPSLPMASTATYPGVDLDLLRKKNLRLGVVMGLVVVLMMGITMAARHQLMPVIFKMKPGPEARHYC